jgi:hypothetical protein
MLTAALCYWVAMQVTLDELTLRISGTVLFIKHDMNGAAAEPEWYQLHGKKAKANPRQFMEYWGTTFLQEGHVLTTKQTGRPPHITDEEALTAAYHMGCDKFKTIRQACQQEPYLVDLLKRPGVNERMLIRRMQEVEPGLSKCHRTEIKVELSPEQKAQRIQDAELWLKDYVLKRKDDLVFMDCKGLWLNRLGKAGNRVWGIRGHPQYLNLIERGKQYSKMGIHLKWYAAVNAALGCFFFKLVTGTTGLQHEGGPYKASVITATCSPVYTASGWIL